jgi:hypothetical protein
MTAVGMRCRAHPGPSDAEDAPAPPVTKIARGRQAQHGGHVAGNCKRGEYAGVAANPHSAPRSLLEKAVLAQRRGAKQLGGPAGRLTSQQ